MNAHVIFLSFNMGGWSPRPLRVFLVFFVAIIIIYIFSMCMKQITVQRKPGNPPFTVRNTENQCDLHGTPPEEKTYVHFPQPKTYTRGECSCNPVRFFVILSMQRSGSGWFETLLNSHPNISSNGEIFWVWERRSNITSIMRTLDTIFNLEWSSSASKNECVAAVGFKWMLNQAEILARFKPTIDVTVLASNLSQAERTMADCLQLFSSTRHIILYYEDITSNHKMLSHVQEFLGVPMQKLRSRQVKIHTRPPSEQVINWEAVHKTLSRTQYGHFLQ